MKISPAENLISTFITLAIIFLIGYGINYFVKNKRFAKMLSGSSFAILFASITIPTLYFQYSKEKRIVEISQKNQEIKDNDLDSLRKISIKMGLPFSRAQQNEWANCVYEKLNPYAQNNTTPDSAFKSQIIGACTNSIMDNQMLNGWTPKFEKMVQDQIIRGMIKATSDTALINRISKSYVECIKKHYPNGFDGPDFIVNKDKILNDCN